MNKLNKRQEAFCQRYAEGENATQAAIAAGYSPRNAKRQAHRLIHDTEIRERIMEIKRSKARAIEVNAEWIIHELTEIAREARQDNDRKYALEALKLLGQHFGALAERHIVSTDVTLAALFAQSCQENIKVIQDTRQHNTTQDTAIAQIEQNVNNKPAELPAYAGNNDDTVVVNSTELRQIDDITSMVSIGYDDKPTE